MRVHVASKGGGLCRRFKRVLFARCNIAKPIVLDTDDIIKGALEGGRLALRVSLGPTLDRRRLSGEVLERFSTGRGGRCGGSVSSLFPTGLGPIVVRLSRVRPRGGIGRVAGRRQRELIRLVGSFAVALAKLHNCGRTVVAGNKMSMGRVSPKAVRSGGVGKLCFTKRILSLSTIAKKCGLRVT